MEGEEKRSDEELVTAFQQGQEEVFEILYKRYYPKVYRLVFGVVRNHHDAEEISNDVLWAVYRALPRFQPRGENAFERWIKRIATNAAINFIKKRDKVKW